MSNTDHHAAPATTAAQTRGLRANSFSAVVMLVIEYGLGVWLNLFTDVPASDQGKGYVGAFAGSVAHGPVVLAIHALLGTLLLVTATFALVRATRLRGRGLTVLSSVALVALIGAWLSGTTFVGDDDDRASLSMAIATGVSILSYTAILFISTPARYRR